MELEMGTDGWRMDFAFGKPHCCHRKAFKYECFAVLRC